MGHRAPLSRWNRRSLRSLVTSSGVGCSSPAREPVTNLCDQPLQLADPVPRLEVRPPLAGLELPVLLLVDNQAPRDLADCESRFAADPQEDRRERSHDPETRTTVRQAAVSWM